MVLGGGEQNDKVQEVRTERNAVLPSSDGSLVSSIRQKCPVAPWPLPPSRVVEAHAELLLLEADPPQQQGG